ncbi:hypothetical protein [Streptomyces sp. NPDC004788]
MPARAETRRPAAYLTTLLVALSAVLSLALPAQPAGATTADTGCTQTTDAVAGYNRGTLDSADEVDCLLLPFPAGAVIVAPEDRMTGSWVPSIEIVDATGNKVCGAPNARYGTCRLSGTAPHYAKAYTAAGSVPPGSSYGIFLQRVDAPEDSTGSCPVLPAGDFTAATPATRFSTADGTFARCATVPAAGHSAKELVQIQKVTGTTDSVARFWVVEDTGRQVCDVPDQRNIWAACDLVAGRSYRVIAAGDGAPGEFDLVRRDVTATAKGCETTPATAVGAPAATGTLPAPGVPVCRQVTTADSRDVLYVNERDGFNAASHAAFGPNGQLSCNTTYEDCGVMGATRYQVVITPSWNSSHTGAPYRLDAQRIAGASGPAPECARPANISYGYGPITGVLDEQHTAVCAGLETYQRDRYDGVVKDTEQEGRGAVLSLYDRSVDRCTDRSTEIDCYLGDPVAGVAKPTVMVLGLQEWTTRTAYSAELVCTVEVCGADPISFRSVDPAIAASGTKARVVLAGTALRAEHKLRIEHPSGARIESTTVSVDTDRTALVADLDLTGAPAGIWTLSAVNDLALDDKVTPLGTFTVTQPGTAGLGLYRPVTPTRLMDTRSGLGVRQGKVGPGGTVTLQVAGKGGLPPVGVTAVVLNVTATAPTAKGFVSVYPDGTTRTSATSLNFNAGQTIPNLVSVPVVNGRVTFYNATGSVDLLADVAGYSTVGEATAATFEPVAPKRLMDTRYGTGVRQGKVPAGGTVTLPVTEPGVTAVVMNVTATNPTAASFVSVYPYGTARPTVSNLNFTAGQTIPNLVVVPVRDGKVTFYNHNGSVDLLADVAGYFTTSGTGSLHKPVTPKRIMDTRSGLGVPKAKVGPGQTIALPVPSGVSAVVMNVTAINATSGGFLTVYPDGTSRPTASNLNFTAGQTIADLVVVPVVNGKVSFYNRSGYVDLTADVTGYYVG